MALLGCPEALEKVPADERSDDLLAVTLRLTAWMLVADGKASSVDEAESQCRRALSDGSAWAKMEENIRLQGGDPQKMVEALGGYRAPVTGTVDATQAGVLSGIDAYRVGMGGVYLGAGRNKADDDVHADVGFELLKKPGDTVSRR